MNRKQGLIAGIRAALIQPRWGVGDLLYTLFVVILTAVLVNRVGYLFSAPRLPQGWVVARESTVTPLQTTEGTTAPETTPTPTPKESVDSMVNQYAVKYGRTEEEQYRIKTTLHFLLFKESRYGKVKHCGDRGFACGPLQFWAETYTNYRKEMIARGYVRELGARENMNDAIETTAWAIANGRELAWGPLARREIQL